MHNTRLMGSRKSQNVQQNAAAAFFGWKALRSLLQDGSTRLGLHPNAELLWAKTKLLMSRPAALAAGSSEDCELIRQKSVRLLSLSGKEGHNAYLLGWAPF